MAAALYFLLRTSRLQDSLTRQNLLERDLRAAVSTFDSEERYVLANNLWAFWKERRALKPLMLPRHYYAGLSKLPGIEPPRSPPQNCFVSLYRSTDLQASSDQFCSYLTSDPTMGRYLYVVAVFQASAVVPHRLGDITLSGDGLELTASNSYGSRTWKVLLQSIGPIESQRFEITAYLKNQLGQIERDKAIEGWAYTQRQASGISTVNVLARIDARLLAPEGDNISPEGNVSWPGPILRSTTMRVTRLLGGDGARKAAVTYQDTGAVKESLPTLYEDFPDARATLSLLVPRVGGEGFQVTEIKPPSDQSPIDAATTPIPTRLDNLLRGEEDSIMRDIPIPDTDLRLRVAYLGPSLQRGVYLAVVDLMVLSSAYLILGYIFLARLVIPMLKLARRAGESIEVSSDPLPYADRSNELGSLVRAFNALLSARSARVLADAEARSARDAEAVRSRDQALRTIGHEIRSPLQTLIARHGPHDPSHRHLLRMARAIKHLYGGSGPEEMFASMTFSMEDLDLAAFASSAVDGLTSSAVGLVRYDGPRFGVICQYDEFALEDVVDHITSNARRYRREGTYIVFSLAISPEWAHLQIANEGAHIPSEALPLIFDYGFSLGPESAETMGQGLFVAMNNVTRMGGRLSAVNVDGGVVFQIDLRRSARHKEL